MYIVPIRTFINPLSPNMHNQYTCPYCQRLILENQFENHHIIPKSAGGEVDSIIRICGICHDYLHYVIPINHVNRYKTRLELMTHDKYRTYLSYISPRKYKRLNVKKLSRMLDNIQLVP